MSQRVEQRRREHDVKSCCADLYASDWVKLLLGDSFHPGGLALTERLGNLLALGSESQVLDVACGQGVSAIHLARHFGCRVTGLDYSRESVEVARLQSRRAGLAEILAFETGDAESLPFRAESFDAVICECSLCTFPDQAASAREMARVLRPGGKVGLSDLTRQGTLAPALQSIAGRIACIAKAQTVDAYLALLEDAGLRPAEAIERHDEALVDLMRRVKLRLFAGEVADRLGQIALPGVDWEAATATARLAEQAVLERRLGYVLVIAQKPDA